MSYSFGVKAATKAEAKEQAETNIKNFVETQDAHKGDVAAIRGTCAAFIDSLPDPVEGEEVHLSCYGSCSGNWQTGEPFRMSSTEMNVKAALVKAQG